MSRKQKFGIEEKAEISDLCIPRNYSVLGNEEVLDEQVGVE